MNRLLASILLLSFLSAQLNELWIILDFKIHQDFIAEVLCINKDEPLLLCSGKCYLSDQLKKAEEKKQQDLPNSVQEKASTTLYIHDLSESAKVIITSNYHEPSFLELCDLFPTTFTFDIFHPPRPVSFII
ncbi:MAG: hypothetical protein R2824_31560 [Saprospiraceae bacterium]|nr:hypothetical protein [Lewinella sp.]